MRQQMLQALAVIIKRGWLEMTADERMTILASVPQLLQMQGNGRLIAVPFVMAIVNEFSSRKASAIGLTWEFHFKCRESFEKRGLRELFETVLNTVQHIVHQQTHLTTDKPIFGSCISAIECVLHWDFINAKEFAGNFKHHTVAFGESRRADHFPKEWSRLLVSAEFLNLMFQLLQLCAKSEDLSHKMAQCLIQLAGLNGPVFISTHAKSEYASHMLNHIFALMKRCVDRVCSSS